MAIVRRGAKKAGRRPAGRRRLPARRYPRKYRPARNVPEWASCSETVSLANPAPGPPPLTNAMFPANGMYQKRDFALDQFTRASTIAQGYQHFRIRKITIKYKPLQDTFTNGGAIASVPQLYYMIDKSGSLPNNPTLAMLKAMGAKGRRFDDKSVVVSWRPAVLDSVATGAVNTSSAQYKISPWLSTNSNQLGVGAWNPSTVDHQGIFWFVEQDMFATGAFYTVEITIEFQFKKPLAQITQGEAPPEAGVATVIKS